MSRRSVVWLAASAIVGIATLVTASTDVHAYRRGGAERAGVYDGGRSGSVHGRTATRRGAAARPRRGYKPHPPCSWIGMI
jgi:hypothetical protein